MTMNPQENCDLFRSDLLLLESELIISLNILMVGKNYKAVCTKDKLQLQPQALVI